MPKIADYPRASIKRAIELAGGIESVGGDCAVATGAETIGMKPGGGFQAVVATAVKLGFVTNKSGRLATTTLFRDYRLAYDEAEQALVAQRAFFNVPIFRAITERFRGRTLPESHFEKILIREFDVPEDIASRVAGYYIEGVKLAKLQGEGGVISPVTDDNAIAEETIESTSAVPGNSIGEPSPAAASSSPHSSNQRYRVRITGPDIDSSVDITEEDDLEIVEAAIRKLRKRLKALSTSESNAE